MTIETTRFLAEAAREFDIHERKLWVGILRAEKFRLVNFFRLFDNHLYSVEQYQHQTNSSDRYARINFVPDPSASFVQTLVVGAMETIGRYARHDHKLHMPLHNNNELKRLSGFGNFFDDKQLLGYYVRPSSFVCSEIRIKKVFGQLTKMVMMKYLVDDSHKDDFFTHVHSPDEREELWHTGVRGFVFTNSMMYVDHHAEIDFIHVPGAHRDILYSAIFDH